MNIWNLVYKEALVRKWRLLTSLATLVLAAGLIVVIQTLNTSSREAIRDYMHNLGANMIVVPAAADLLAFYSAEPVNSGSAALPESHYFKLLEARIHGVAALDPRLALPLDVDGKRVILTGVLPDRILRPREGRQGADDPWSLLDELEPQSGRAVLGAELRNLMDKATASGLRMAGADLEVAGVLPRQGTIDDLRIYLHLRFLQRLLDRKFALSEIRILYTGDRDLEQTASGIEGLLGNTRVLTHRRTAGKQIAILESIRGYALVLLVVVLVLGWLGIANEMYHNAHARRREIATLIALGATTGTILEAFLMKAVLLALLGGLLGYGVGTLTAAHLGPALLRIEVSPDLSLIPLAVLAAVLFSALSSLLPAWRASRIEPAEILQED